MRALAPALVFAALCSLPSRASAQDVNGFEARSLKGSTGTTLPYRLYKVQNPVAGAKYPIILFLHGAGERGDNNTSQLMANAGATVWATAAHQAKHPAYVVAPQCPLMEQWVHTDWGLGSYSTDSIPVSGPLTTALEIVEAVSAEFQIDPNRHYITGLSMGGYGTWDSIARNPELFAAALPICGSADLSKAELLKDLPIWTFHGDADTTVPPKGTRDMVAALKAVGSTVKYTEYPGVGHNSWDMTYANEEVIDWLFTFTKAAPPMGGAGGTGGAGMGGEAMVGGMGGNGGAAMGGSGGASAGMPTAMAGMGGASTSGASTGGSGGSISTTGNADSGDDGGCSIAGPTRLSLTRFILFGAAAALVVSRRRSRAA